MSTMQKRLAPVVYGDRSVKGSLLSIVQLDDLEAIDNQKKSKPKNKSMTLHHQAGVPVVVLEKANDDTPEPFRGAARLYYGWNVVHAYIKKPFIPRGVERLALETFAQRDPSAEGGWERFDSLVLEAQNKLHFADKDKLWEFSGDFDAIVGASRNNSTTGTTDSANGSTNDPSTSNNHSNHAPDARQGQAPSTSELYGMMATMVQSSATVQKNNNEKFAAHDQELAETRRLNEETASLVKENAQQQRITSEQLNQHIETSNKRHEESAERHDASDRLHEESTKRHDDSDSKHLESAQKQKAADAAIQDLQQESARKDKKIREMGDELECIKSSLGFGGENSVHGASSGGGGHDARSLFSGSLPPPLSAGGSGFGRLPSKMSSLRTRSVPKTASPIPEHAAVAPKPLVHKKFDDDDDSFASLDDDDDNNSNSNNSVSIPKEIAVTKGAPENFFPPTPVMDRKPAAVETPGSASAGGFSFGGFDSGAGNFNDNSGSIAGTPARQRSPPELRSALKKSGGNRSSPGSVSFKKQVDVQNFTLVPAHNPANENGLSTAMDQPYGTPYKQDLREPLLSSYQEPEVRSELDTYASLIIHSHMTNKQIDEGKKQVAAQALEEEQQLEEASVDSEDSRDEDDAEDDDDAADDTIPGPPEPIAADAAAADDAIPGPPEPIVADAASADNTISGPPESIAADAAAAADDTIPGPPELIAADAAAAADAIPGPPEPIASENVAVADSEPNSLPKRSCPKRLHSSLAPVPKDFAPEHASPPPKRARTSHAPLSPRNN